VTLVVAAGVDRAFAQVRKPNITILATGGTIAGAAGSMRPL